MLRFETPMPVNLKTSVGFYFYLHSISFLNCCKASLGDDCRMNVSPMRNPRKPALRNLRTTSGCDMPLSDTKQASEGRQAAKMCEADGCRD